MASPPTDRDPFPRMADLIPEGRVRGAVIEHRVITEDDSRLSLVRAVVTGRRDEYTSPGTICVLTVDNVLMMSDSDMERRSNTPFIRAARGDVLIGGLGMGMVVSALMRKPGVRSITVIERSRAVFKLIVPALNAALPTGPPLGTAPRLIVSIGDVFTWSPARLRSIRTKGAPAPARTFDTIYMDIWPHRCPDNLLEMEVLHARYRRWLNPGGWWGCWYGPELAGHLNPRGIDRFGACTGVTS